MTVTAARLSTYAPPIDTSSRRKLAPNERWSLDVLDRIWLVTAGSVEIFAVRSIEGEPVGPRRWLFTASADVGIFSLPRLDDTSITLVAIAGEGAEIEELDFRNLREAAPLSAEARGYVAMLLDSWLTAIAGVVGRAEEMQATEHMSAGATATFEADQRIGVSGAPLWIHHAGGHSWFAGRGGMVALKESSGAFPLAPGAWILARAQVELRAQTTSSWLEADPQWDDFELFRTVLARWVTASEQSHEMTERARRLRRAAVNQRMKEGALAELVGAIVTSTMPAATASDIQSNALLGVCRAIGAREGITFNAPAEWEVAEGIRNPLGAICVASHVRSRRVALKGDWWTHDNGSVLCRLKEGRVPLAALRERGGRYFLHNPVEGTRVPMTAELAELMEPFGVVFYRPLPDTPITTWTLVKFVLGGMTGSLWNIAVVAVLAGLLGLFMPIATGFVFDQVIPSSMHGQLTQVFIGLTIAALSAQTFELVRAYAVSRLNGRSATAMQSAVFDRLLQLPAPFFARFTIGDLVSRVGGVSQVRTLLSAGAITALLGGLTGALNFFLLFYFAPRLAWIAGAFVLLTCGVLVLLSWRAKRLQDQIQDLSGKLAGFVFQLVTGIAKLRVSGAEDRALAMWAHQYVEKVRLDNKAFDANVGVILVTGALPIMASIVTFGAVGAMLESPDAISVAAFVAFNSAMGAFIAAAIATSTTVVNMVQIIPLMKRASVILLETPEVTADRPSPGRLNGRIEGRNLSFRYNADQPFVLTNVSFYAEPGEFVAFVGPSGSGKSTALRLLLGFEKPEAGAIYFDGQDLATLDVSAVRRQMGVVLQSSRLMAGDIFTNIVGSSPLAMDDAWEAAEMAGFADDVRDMPMQMHTVISEGGSTLSGGQRQRLLIARALVHRPRLILFDEATSALDNRTQTIVTESLEKMRATRIVIAHRLSTIQNADRIYVIDGGRVVEWGSPSDLLAAGGVFAKLAARQLA